MSEKEIRIRPSFLKDVAEFKARFETEREFCEQLFRDSTIRLLAFKYAYYVWDDSLVKDITYDGMEHGWLIMGTALGHLHGDEAGPCIEFDYNHPLAKEGIELATKLSRKGGKRNDAEPTSED